MQTVVILGAAGRVGDVAARGFLERGWKVKGLARGAKAGMLLPGVEPVEVDALDLYALIAACEGADVIVNALNPLYTEWEEKVLPMARNVIAAAEAVGATHMLPGNVYNFGHGIGLETAEDAPRHPSTGKARIRIAMEDLFAERAAKSGVRTVVLRAGDYFGGRRPETCLDIFILRNLARDIFTWPGPGDLPHAFAYLPDLGLTFALVAEHRDSLPAFDCFHFAGHALTGDEMQGATETVIGRSLKRRGVPWTLLRAAGLVSPLLREVTAMSYLWRTAHSLDGRKLEKLLGTVPHTPLVEALGQAIAELALDRHRLAAA